MATTATPSVADLRARAAAHQQDMLAARAEGARRARVTVYAFHLPHTQQVKIGYTSDVRRRQREIANGCGRPVRLIATRVCADLSGAAALETALHAHYAARRMRGEWFALPDAERRALRSVMETV